MYRSLYKLTSEYGKSIVLIFYIHCIKLEKSAGPSFPHLFLAVFTSLVMQWISSFILSSDFFFFKNCLHVFSFLQSGGLYANKPFTCL